MADRIVDEVRADRLLPPPAVAREIRVAAGVTQKRVAEELGVHRVSVARWEAGERRPRGAARRGYAELLADLAREIAR